MLSSNKICWRLVKFKGTECLRVKCVTREGWINHRHAHRFIIILYYHFSPKFHSFCDWHELRERSLTKIRIQNRISASFKSVEEKDCKNDSLKKYKRKNSINGIDIKNYHDNSTEHLHHNFAFHQAMYHLEQINVDCTKSFFFLFTVKVFTVLEGIYQLPCFWQQPRAYYFYLVS